MGRLIKFIMAAVPIVALGAALTATFPELRRYLKMRRM